MHSQHTHMEMAIMFVFENTCKCFQNLCLNTNAYITTQPTNTNSKICLEFIQLDMKQFLSLFNFKWLKPLNTQHPPFCAQGGKSKPLF